MPLQHLGHRLHHVGAEPHHAGHRLGVATHIIMPIIPPPVIGHSIMPPIPGPIIPPRGVGCES